MEMSRTTSCGSRGPSRGERSRPLYCTTVVDPAQKLEGLEVPLSQVRGESLRASRRLGVRRHQLDWHCLVRHHDDSFRNEPVQCH